MFLNDINKENVVNAGTNFDIELNEKRRNFTSERYLGIFFINLRNI